MTSYESRSAACLHLPPLFSETTWRHISPVTSQKHPDLEIFSQMFGSRGNNENYERPDLGATASVPNLNLYYRSRSFMFKHCDQLELCRSQPTMHCIWTKLAFSVKLLLKGVFAPCFSVFQWAELRKVVLVARLQTLQLVHDVWLFIISYLWFPNLKQYRMRWGFPKLCRLCFWKSQKFLSWLKIRRDSVDKCWDVTLSVAFETRHFVVYP